MTNAQNLKDIVAKLMEEENKLKMVYEEAKEQNSHAYKRMLVWEKAYTASGDDEEVGRTLDKVYDEYNKINEVMHKTKEQVEAVKKAIETLLKVADTIEWLGL